MGIHNICMRTLIYSGKQILESKGIKKVKKFSFFLSASSCELIEVEMCQGLTYNLTSFPNIWLSIADQREAATLLRQYRVKVTITIQINQLLLIAAILGYFCMESLYKFIIQACIFIILISKQTLPCLPLYCRPGADGACMFRALAEAGVWDFPASVQPPGRGPPALPLRLHRHRATMQPSPGSLLLQLALQLPPSA